MKIRLGAIIRRLERERILREPADPNSLDLVVSDIATDSRRLQEGTLFCAIRGTSGDGHDYLSVAAAAGASAALVEEIDPSVDLLQVRVTDGRRAAAFAAAEFFSDPWEDLRMIGVTGTNGKTTTAAILHHLLNRTERAASMGTLGVIGPDGRVVPGTEGLTTPGPVEAGRWLRHLRGEGVSAIAMEVSSHALHQDRVAAVRFDAALFTNLSRDHLDYHPTLEEYRAAKLGLLDLMKPEAAAVLNGDDAAWRDVEVTGRRRIRYAVGSPSDVYAADLDPSSTGTRWTLNTPDGSARVFLPLLGSYNVSNAVGAAAVLWSLGWETEKIASDLASVPQIPGRLEQIPTGSDHPAVLIDFAHTPDALERAMAVLRPLTVGRLIVVFGAGGDRDRGKRAEMGRVAAAGADLSVVTSDNPRMEDPEVIAGEIESGMGNARRTRVIDRREAIRSALAEAGPGDIVLLAGKGHERYQIWGEERRPFDERVVVSEILTEEGGHS